MVMSLTEWQAKEGARGKRKGLREDEEKGLISDTLTLTFRCWGNSQVDLPLPGIVLPKPGDQPHILSLSHNPCPA